MKIILDTVESLAKKRNIVNTDELDEEASRTVVRMFCRYVKKLMTSVDELPLSVRAARILKQNDIWTVLDLRAAQPAVIARMSQCGPKVRSELREQVARIVEISLPNWQEHMMLLENQRRSL